VLEREDRDVLSEQLCILIFWVNEKKLKTPIRIDLDMTLVDPLAENRPEAEGWIRLVGFENGYYFGVPKKDGAASFLTRRMMPFTYRRSFRASVILNPKNPEIDDQPEIKIGEQKPSESAKSTDVNSILGRGLGRMTEIEGRIIKVREDKPARQDWIEVYWVNEKRLEKPVSIRFSRMSAFGEKKLSVGDWIRISGHEGGGFSGIPRAIQKSKRLPFDFRHFFSTSAALEPKQEPPGDGDGEKADKRK